MKNIRVVIWGFGAMGSGMARMLLKKKGVEICGVIDGWDKLIGRDMYEVLGEERGDRSEVRIQKNAEDVISRDNCDIVLLATDSFTAKAWPKIKFCLEAGVDVISTAEELSYAWAQEPELAAEIDRLARQKGVSVLGTGVNPGFVLDLLILALSGSCEDIVSIKASRINDLSPFGRAVMEEQGVGFSPERFREKNEAGELAGHVGFPESIGLIAEGLGISIDRLVQTKDPIISHVERKAPHAHVMPGDVAGIRQQVHAFDQDGREWIHLDHPQQVMPELEGIETGDFIELDTGSYKMNLRIQPETPGGIGTIAMVVNAIPHVLKAEPGLLSLLDLPIPHAILGDMRKVMERNTKRPRLYKAGDIVVIERTSLPEGERADSVPDDTARTPLKVWLKGSLQKDAHSGETVEIRTAIGRLVEGRLSDLSPNYQHDFGQLVPELGEIGRQVREIVFTEVQS